MIPPIADGVHDGGKGNCEKIVDATEILKR